MSVTDKLVEHLEDLSEKLQTLANELESGDMDPMMMVSAQIHNEKDFQKLDNLTQSYLIEVDEDLEDEHL